MNDRGLFGDPISQPQAIIISAPGHKYRHNHTEKTAGKQPRMTYGATDKR